MDEYAILAEAIRLYVDEHGKPDLELSKPVAEVLPDLVTNVEGIITPYANFQWLDDEKAFAEVAGNGQFRAAMSEQGLALTVGKRGNVLYLNISTISESEEPI